MENNNYCIIMAGGVGSRFWPLSRMSKPKQFLDVLGTGQTLIQATYQRFRKILPPGNILVVGNAEHLDLIREQLPELPEDNILLEPLRRNTAPCIAYGSYKIHKKSPEANIIVAPSDHLIVQEDRFLKATREGLEFVGTHDALLTLGIPPSRPETGYGYIQANGTRQMDAPWENFRKVKTFTEKPDHKMARVFHESGEFFWNSGIFFWSLKSILQAFENYLPEMDSLFRDGMKHYDTEREQSYIEEIYASCRNISVDYGIMEHAENVYVHTVDIGWSDLGTWGSIYDKISQDDQGNAVMGDKVMCYDMENSLVRMPEGKLAVLQGLKDYVVVESDNVLLVCRMEDEQKIRNIVNDVKFRQGDQFI